jgi:hypothetical protein
MDRAIEAKLQAIEGKLAEIDERSKATAEMVRAIYDHFGVGHMPARSLAQIQEDVRRRVVQLKRSRAEKQKLKGGE